ncbi:MAG: SRPBCC family protein [Candidatus Dormibacteria bacterium]
MVEVSAEATLPVTQQQAFDTACDLDRADWLPSIRRLHHIAGPLKGRGARYDVEVRMLGKQLQGILVCTDFVAPRRIVCEIEEGLDLEVVLGFSSVTGGCKMKITASYTIGGVFGGAVERASEPAARHEVARAVEQFAAQFGRKERRARV